MNHFNIVYATDDGYLVPTLVSAVSALRQAKANGREIAVHILDDHISDGRWQWFETRIRALCGSDFGIVRHKLDTRRFVSMRKWHGSVAAYARLLIPDLLKGEDWCLYCDGDTFFTGSPLLLRDICDDQYALIGHRDNFTQIQPNWFSAHGYSFNPDEYVCSGFLLMNLEAFRRDHLAEKCLEFIEAHNDVVYPDQDALNIVCHKKIRQLNDGWGEFGFRCDDIAKPGCIHYGSRQPWKLCYMPHRGILDVERLWFAFATKVCGLTSKDFGPNYSLLRHFCLECAAVWFKFVFVVLGLIPGLKRRSIVFKRQSFGRRQIKEFIRCIS